VRALAGLILVLSGRFQTEHERGYCNEVNARFESVFCFYVGETTCEFPVPN